MKKTPVRVKRSERAGSLVVAGQCLFLLAACGGDDAQTPGQPTTGIPPAGGITPPAATGGSIASGAAGKTATGTAATGAATSGGSAGIGAAGKAATASAGTTASAAGGSSAAAGGTTGGAGTGTATAGAGTAKAGSGAGGAGATTGEGKPSGDSSCLDGITDYEKAGPFKFEAKPAGNIKMWIPTVPAGCKVPVIHLANGTGASCSSYQPALDRLASHGFLTTCYEDPNTGAGTQGLEAFTKALEMYPDLALHALGSTGHSQGGQAAFTVLALTEEKFGADYIYAGLAMEPASGFGTQPAGGSWQSVYKKIKSPMFMFSGTADMLVSEGWVQQGFEALDPSIEAYWWSANGATHIPVPNDPEMQVSIPWFRWKLLGDKAACAFFKKMPDGDDWDERKKQNDKPCE